MNYIFFGLVAISILVSFFNGTTENVMNAMLDGCNIAIKTVISLIGIMAFWLGIMRIAEKSGFVSMLSKLITPFITPLFKDIPKDNFVSGDIAMSLSANALGLTNAATPIGIRVMKKLQDINKEKDSATDSMCMFLAMNTAGFQIVPATVIAVLVGYGAKNPAEIILPTLIVTTLAFISAILIALVLKKLWNLRGMIND